MQYTASDSSVHETIESAKRAELIVLCAGSSTPLDELVKKPREAIAILKVGLPRKPRTPKPKAVKAKKPTTTTAA